jgi:hypothetical protein
MAVQTKERRFTTKARAGRNGVKLRLSAEELERAGFQAGEDVVLVVRRYTARDWLRDNAGRIFCSEQEFYAAMAELRALPEK